MVKPIEAMFEANNFKMSNQLTTRGWPNDQISPWTLEESNLRNPKKP